MAGAPVVTSDWSGGGTRGRNTHGTLATEVDEKVRRAEVKGTVGSGGVEIVEKVVEVASTNAKQLEDGRPTQEDGKRTQCPREVLSLELDSKEAVNVCCEWGGRGEKGGRGEGEEGGERGRRTKKRRCPCCAGSRRR